MSRANLKFRERTKAMRDLQQLLETEPVKSEAAGLGLDVGKLNELVASTNRHSYGPLLALVALLALPGVLAAVLTFGAWWKEAPVEHAAEASAVPVEPGFDLIERLGKIGDAFGALGVAAVIVAFYTLWIQREEIAVARAEAADARLEGYREMMRRQGLSDRSQQVQSLLQTIELLRSKALFASLRMGRDGIPASVANSSIYGGVQQMRFRALLLDFVARWEDPEQDRYYEQREVGERRERRELLCNESKERLQSFLVKKRSRSFRKSLLSGDGNVFPGAAADEFQSLALAVAKEIDDTEQGRGRSVP